MGSVASAEPIASSFQGRQKKSLAVMALQVRKFGMDDMACIYKR